MSDTDRVYSGSERREDGNAELPAKMDEIDEEVTASLKVSKDDMSQLFELLRDLYRRGLGSRSPDLLRHVREEHPEQLSPAMLTLLDNVLSRGN